MENKYENIDEIIARILAGEATPYDEQMLNEWLKLSDDNRREFEFAKKLFDESSGLPFMRVETDQAWEKVRSRISTGKSTGKVISIGRSRAKQFLRIAAMLLMAAGLSAAVYQALTGSLLKKERTYASEDTVSRSAFPDGSWVTLNRNSRLAYSESRLTKRKTVTLQGEAFFELASSSDGAFLVKAGALIIEDIGTSFNVRAYPQEKIIVVAVATGEVRIYTASGDTLNLIAGQSAEYNSAAGKFTRFSELDRNQIAYRDKIFVFDNTELSAIVKLLNDIYGSKIILENESIARCRLTAKFSNETSDSMLEIIAETLHLTIKRNNSEIILSGNACN